MYGCPHQHAHTMLDGFFAPLDLPHISRITLVIDILVELSKNIFYILVSLHMTFASLPTKYASNFIIVKCHFTICWSEFIVFDSPWFFFWGHPPMHFFHVIDILFLLHAFNFTPIAHNNVHIIWFIRWKQHDVLFFTNHCAKSHYGVLHSWFI